MMCYVLPHRPGVVDERRAIARLAELQHEAVVLMKAASTRQRRPPVFIPSDGIPFAVNEFVDVAAN